jgi:hypothetical protein
VGGVEAPIRMTKNSHTDNRSGLPQAAPQPRRLTLAAFGARVLQSPSASANIQPSKHPSRQFLFQGLRFRKAQCIKSQRVLPSSLPQSKLPCRDFLLALYLHINSDGKQQPPPRTTTYSPSNEPDPSSHTSTAWLADNHSLISILWCNHNCQIVHKCCDK